MTDLGRGIRNPVNCSLKKLAIYNEPVFVFRIVECLQGLPDRTWLKSGSLTDERLKQRMVRGQRSKRSDAP
jgi:hypothetical protein